MTLLHTLTESIRNCWKDIFHGTVGIGVITVSQIKDITLWLQLISLLGGITLCLFSLVSMGFTIEQKWRDRKLQVRNHKTKQSKKYETSH